MSHIEVDPVLNKLSTEKLIRMLRNIRKRNKGLGCSKIKRILNDREHVQRGKLKIVIAPESCKRPL